MSSTRPARRTVRVVISILVHTLVLLALLLPPLHFTDTIDLKGFAQTFLVAPPPPPPPPPMAQALAKTVPTPRRALEAMAGNQQLRLNACSRWPERQACGQECLAQIEEVPKACLVWTITNRWYQGQACVYCHKPFGDIHWHDHPPALLNRDRKTVQWNKIPAENLQDALGTHGPVCWSCHMAETFRCEHPELVVDRPSSKLRMNLYH